MDRRRSRSPGLLALAAAAGFVDAVSYMGFGRVFTANMTGNTVLLGVALARGRGIDAARAAAALAGFCIGVAMGVRAMRRGADGWPRIAAPALALEATALAGLLICWALAGSDARYVLIGTSAIAMGLQSAATRAAAAGVNTTYITGTLTNAITRLLGEGARGSRPERAETALPAGILAIYAGGALAGGFAEFAWRAGSMLVPTAIVAALAATGMRARRPGRR